MTDYGELFRELAVPRLVGTPNHRKIREVLKRELVARGFDVAEHEFSGRVSRALFGVPGTVRGTNLIAARPSAVPSIWLVAHYDSKGQPISMAIRLVGFGALVLGVLLLLVSVVAAALVLVVGLGILAHNRITDNSAGAVDNATGLVAVLMTVDQLSQEFPVGVVFPDAEEFGLVGAKALARERAALFTEAAVINLDGLDDTGRVTAMTHRPGAVGREVAAALQARRRRWLPVVVDGIALARVSRECVSILKGTWRTMRVVHRPADAAGRVRLDGAATVAAGLARVLRGR